MIQPQDLEFIILKSLPTVVHHQPARQATKRDLFGLGISIDFQCCQGFFFFYKSITNYNRTKLGEHPEIKKAITESIKDPMARSQAAGIVCDRVRKSQCWRVYTHCQTSQRSSWFCFVSFFKIVTPTETTTETNPYNDDFFRAACLCCVVAR